ncbi:MAG: ABC transporter permease [Endomicrobia bacterium]|nr:ABC transporter permease [Endomicrobiia bacterium]
MNNLIIEFGKYVLFCYETVSNLFTGKFEKKIFLQQLYIIGVQSLPVTILTSFAVGMVLCLQSGTASISVLNEPAYVGTVVAFSLVKELGPMLTAVVLVGRIAAAITAELGTMKVTEQIDAMYTLGTEPIKYLVIPRIIAFTVSIPIITVFSNIIGIIGGGIISSFRFNIPSTIYYQDALDYLYLDDFFHGLIKSVIFGILISTVACFKGFYTDGGAEGVGRSTTSCVVISIVSLLISDYFLSSLLIAIGIG